RDGLTHRSRWTSSMRPLKEHELAAAKIFAFMRKRALTLDNLIAIGGEDLSSPNPKKVEKAKRVEKCWSLMAKFGVKYADLEHLPCHDPTKPSCRRRGEGHFSEAIENKEVLGIGAKAVNG